MESVGWLRSDKQELIWLHSRAFDLGLMHFPRVRISLDVFETKQVVAGGFDEIYLIETGRD